MITSSNPLSSSYNTFSDAEQRRKRRAELTSQINNLKSDPFNMAVGAGGGGIMMAKGVKNAEQIRRLQEELDRLDY